MIINGVKIVTDGLMENAANDIDITGSNIRKLIRKLFGASVAKELRVRKDVNDMYAGYHIYYKNISRKEYLKVFWVIYALFNDFHVAFVEGCSKGYTKAMPFGRKYGHCVIL